jgi:hypothetical protein
VPVHNDWATTHCPVVAWHVKLPHKLLRAAQLLLAHLLTHAPLLQVPVSGPLPASHSVVDVGCSAASTHWPVAGLHVLATQVVDGHLLGGQLATQVPLLPLPAAATAAKV